jgi:cytochrome b561
MQQSLMTMPRYDSKTICLHALTAALVIVLWGLGQSIDWFPGGAPRVFARSAHIGLGALLACVLAYRIWWRATGGAHLPAAGAGAWKVLARAVHIALYACMLATVMLGLANTWVRGDNLFYLYTIPAFDAGNEALRDAVEDGHGFAANLLLLLAGLHAIAGVMHQYVLKVDVLGRMLRAPRRR